MGKRCWGKRGLAAGPAGGGWSGQGGWGGQRFGGGEGSGGATPPGGPGDPAEGGPAEGGPAVAVRATFGEPTRRYQFGGFTVSVRDVNLLTKLR